MNMVYQVWWIFDGTACQYTNETTLKEAAYWYSDMVKRGFQTWIQSRQL